MTNQTTLPVGETRPPAVLENVNTHSIGSIVSMVMCAHRFDPEDLEGWHTHEPEAVTRGWVQENAEATVARLLGDAAQDHSTRSPAWIPEEEHERARAQARDDDGREQARLVTDGGFEHVEHTATFSCDSCDDFELEKSYSGMAGTPGEDEYDRIQAPETCPACGGPVSRDDVATDGGYQIEGASVVGGEYMVKLAILTEYRFPVVAGHLEDDAVDTARELALHSDLEKTKPVDRDVIHSDVEKLRDIYADDVEAGQIKHIDGPTAPSEGTFWDDSRHFPEHTEADQ